MINFLKDLSNESVNSELTNSEILDKLILNNPIEPYNESTIYNKGNMIISTSAGLEILECNDDAVTGLFNPSKWDVKPSLINDTGEIDLGVF